MRVDALPTVALPTLAESAAPITVWLIVLTFVFVECAFVVGLFLPGDSLLLAAGVVLADGGHRTSALALAGVATVVAVAGNEVGYLTGRYAGTRIVARRGGRVLNRANLARATRYVERWGFWSIVVARWLPWVRTLAPVVAGAARMDNRRFLLANAIGAGAWVPSLLLLGYHGSGLLDGLPWLRTAVTGAVVVVVVVGTTVGLLRYRSELRRPVDDDDAPLPEPTPRAGS